MPPRRKQEQGVVWVSQSGDIYKDEQIDVDTIRKLMVSNVYARGLWKKLKNMVFNEPPTIEVFNPEGEADEELSNQLEIMFEDADCWMSMQKAYMDVFFFGASFFNPIWGDKDDEWGIQLMAMRHLPAYSFNNPSNLWFDQSRMYHGILNGVVYDKDKDVIRYFQTDEFDTIEITNILHVKEPDSDSLAGDPVIYPLVPVIEMLKFAWNSNMQTVNRIGAPIMFIKVTGPRPASPAMGGSSDIEYANKILQNWGKDTSFTLRDNMELIPLPITEGTVSQSIIDQLEKLLLDHISPAKFVTKTGTLIGGSTEAEGEMMEAYVRGQHTWLCEAFEGLLNQYFLLNGFEDGYYCRIHVPITLPNQSMTAMNQAQVGYQTQTVFKNEIRALLGFEPLDEESLAKLQEEYAASMPNPFGNPLGGASGTEGATGNEDEKEMEQMTTILFRTPAVVKGSEWDIKKAEGLAKTLDGLLKDLGDEVLEITQDSEDEKSRPFRHGIQHIEKRLEFASGCGAGDEGSPGFQPDNTCAAGDGGSDGGEKGTSPKAGKVGKMSLGKIKDKQYRKEIETQISELTKQTGISIASVTTHTEEEHDSLGFYNAGDDAMSFRADMTKERLKQEASLEGLQEDAEKAKGMIAAAEKTGNKKHIADTKALYQELADFKGYKETNYSGNGERHAVVDHEFGHRLARARMNEIASGALSIDPSSSDAEIKEANRKAYEKTGKITKMFGNCKVFATKEKFSAYAATGKGEQEAFAEVYAYWKGGNKIPKDIEADFIKLERGNEL